MAFSQLQTRVITATFLVVAFVAVLFLSAHNCVGHWILALSACAAQALCAFEFARITSTKEPGRYATYVLVCLIPCIAVLLVSMREGLCDAALFSFVPFALATGIFLSILVATLYVLYRGKDDLEITKALAVELYPGLILIAIGGGSLTGLAALPHATWVVSWLFLVVCINDIAAYFGGSHFRGLKVVPALSPNKTLSGYLCGLGAGVVVGVYTAHWLGFRASLVFFILFSLIVVVAAQTGDLLKSYLKRHSGVKDSGSLLPGHGGFLDRLDGVLFSAPIVYVVVVWMLRL